LVGVFLAWKFSTALVMWGVGIIGAVLVLHGHFPRVVTIKRITLAAAVFVVIGVAIGIGWLLGSRRSMETVEKHVPPKRPSVPPTATTDLVPVLSPKTPASGGDLGTVKAHVEETRKKGLAKIAKEPVAEVVPNPVVPPATVVQNSAPYGIANSGIVGQAIVNNYMEGPKRSITADKRQTLVNALSAIRAEVTVEATIADNESLEFGQILLAVFQDAQWTTHGVVPVYPSGPPPQISRGVRVGFHGDSLPDGAHVRLDDRVYPGSIIALLLRAGISWLTVTSSPDIKHGDIELLVLPNPQRDTTAVK
jgi:hypothetical protein